MSFGPFPIAFKLDRTRNASFQAFAHLRELIVSMTLVPGTQLDRAELAEYFDLSSTPVRDALTRLSKENLVDIYPQHATIVRGIDVDSIYEVHFLRLSLELEITASLAKHPDSTLINALEGLLSQQVFALSRKDFDTFVRVDMEFHQRMFKAANVEELWHFVRSKSGNLDRLRRLHVPLADKAKVVLADHTSIVSAIASGDVKLAQTCVREHLSGSLNQLEALRQQYPDYFLGGS